MYSRCCEIWALVVTYVQGQLIQALEQLLLGRSKVSCQFQVILLQGRSDSFFVIVDGLS